MGDSWNKKEREKKKQKDKRDKADKMRLRKENSKGGSMMAYVDENGNISDTPPDPRKKVEIKLEDIQIGVPEYVPPTQQELTRNGKITFFNYEKGFGFIKDLVSQESIFVHANNLTDAVKENDRVTFEIEMGPRGPLAVRVKTIV